MTAESCGTRAFRDRYHRTDQAYDTNIIQPLKFSSKLWFKNKSYSKICQTFHIKSFQKWIPECFNGSSIAGSWTVLIKFLNIWVIEKVCELYSLHVTELDENLPLALNLHCAVTRLIFVWKHFLFMNTRDLIHKIENVLRVILRSLLKWGYASFRCINFYKSLIILCTAEWFWNKCCTDLIKNTINADLVSRILKLQTNSFFFFFNKTKKWNGEMKIENRLKIIYSP